MVDVPGKNMICHRLLQFVYDSGQEGWLTDRNGDKNYRTTNSGVTWQAATPSQYPKSLERLPEGTTLSGWQAGSLGWSVTSTGNCSGEKSSPDFTCRSETTLLPVPGWRVNLAANIITHARVGDF